MLQNQYWVFVLHFLIGIAKMGVIITHPARWQSWSYDLICIHTVVLYWSWALTESKSWIFGFEMCACRISVRVDYEELWIQNRLLFRCLILAMEYWVCSVFILYFFMNHEIQFLKKSWSRCFEIQIHTSFLDKSWNVAPFESQPPCSNNAHTKYVY